MIKWIFCLFICKIERQLSAYLGRVEDVLGKGWESHVEGQRLKADGDNFKQKLDTQQLFEDWVRKVSSLLCYSNMHLREKRARFLILKSCMNETIWKRKTLARNTCIDNITIPVVKVPGLLLMIVVFDIDIITISVVKVPGLLLMMVVFDIDKVTIPVVKVPGLLLMMVVFDIDIITISVVKVPGLLLAMVVFDILLFLWFLGSNS